MKNTIVLMMIALSFNYLGAQTDLDEELIAYEEYGPNRLWKVENISGQTIYGSHSEGYPEETSGYTGKTVSSGNTINCGFADDIYYSIYKLSVNGHWLNIDFRDCDYQSAPSGPGYYYNTPDVKIEYFPDSSTFKFKVYDNTVNWRKLASGRTIYIWGDNRKTVESHPNTCFGNPGIPSGFDSELESIGGGDSCPKLTWTANTEYDIAGYQLQRNLNGTGWTIRATISDETDTDYTDYSVIVGSSGNTNYASYKLRAFDWGDTPLYSYFTSVETVRYNHLEKIGEVNAQATMSIVPGKFKLHPNSPNPFNPSTNISFDLPEPSNVNITIYNIKGEAVDFINLDNLAPGIQKLSWSGVCDIGESLPSGIYLLNIEAIGINTNKVYTSQNKMHLLK